MNNIKIIEDRIRKHFPYRWTKKDIKQFLGTTQYDVDVNALNENLNLPIRDFLLRGGKRLRPKLFLTALEVFHINPKKHLDIALIIEIVHNGTLVLDDIEDKGLLRRGKKTSHIKYGLDTATNMGFSLHILPLIFLTKARNLNDSHKLRLWKIYSEELINVSFGQALDIHWHKNHATEVNLNKYLEMVRLKTGSLMRMSLRSACAIADTTHDTEMLFKDFAENIGMAFQIIDDCLDIDPTKKFGKAYGNDITEGKLSLPVLYTLQKVDKKKKQRLISIMSKHTRNKKLLTEALEIIIESGSREKAIVFAKDLLTTAWENLYDSFDSKKDLDKLKEITYFLVERDY